MQVVRESVHSRFKWFGTSMDEMLRYKQMTMHFVNSLLIILVLSKASQIAKTPFVGTFVRK